MKKFILILLSMSLHNLVQAQYKNDKWIVGIKPSLMMDFQKDSTVNSLIYETKSIRFEYGHSNINDSLSVLFSCNGFKIYDKYGDIMDGGDFILPQKLINSSQGGVASRFKQQSIILPKKDNQFYVFTWGISDKNFDKAQISGWYINDILTYAIVDLNENDGKGKVISKMNYLIQDDSLSMCQMSAVRHANGRDWWLVKPHFSRHRFYTFLVTPDGIIQQPIQEFNSPAMSNGIFGQGNFSKDGSLYAMTSESNPSRTTQVNYFDRCTGKMSKFKTIPWHYDSSSQQWFGVGEVSFSSNNRFVYLTNNIMKVQYDLSNDERIELNTDSIFYQTNTSYLGDDNKIYFGNFNNIIQEHWFSTIEFPDVKGIGAKYCFKCYDAKNEATKSPPNNPNYELGALKGSLCDTIKPIIKYEQISIYPNPVKDILNVQLPSSVKNYELIIYNAIGQVILNRKEENVSQSKLNIPLQGVANGVYTIRIITEGNNYRSKFLKR